MYKLGIIVPYRDREEQLEEFIDYLDKFVNFDNILEPTLIVVNQRDRKKFNRGKLLNIGFIEAKKQGCDYVIFHDVDMLPVKADYTYSDKPLQLANEFVADGDFNRVIQRNYFGGVTLFPVEDFEKINGYSNKYKGWGFEDDDLLLRCRENNLELETENYRTVKWDRKVVSFNGKNSLVNIPNNLKTVRPFSIICTFYPGKIQCDPSEITDEFAAFGVPGHDFNISFNSFSRYKLEFFLKDNTPVSLTSDYIPNLPVQVVATINPRKKRTSFFINGKLIDEKYWGNKPLLDYSKEPYMYLGTAAPERKSKQKYFLGDVSNFGIINSELDKKTIHKIFLADANYPLHSQFENLDWDTYLDASFFDTQTNEWVDVIRGVNYKANNCKVEYRQTTSVSKVLFPFRRKSKFLLRKHEEAGYTLGFWKDWSGRENQLRYYRLVNEGVSKYQEDGLDTCKYRSNIEIDESRRFKYIKINSVT